MSANCPLCRSNVHAILFYGVNSDNPSSTPIPILMCNGCHLVISKPASNSPNELYYENYYGEHTSDKPFNRFAITLFQFERKLKVLGHKKSGYILDFGCGDGTFLNGLGQNWRCFGYEPSQVGRRLSSIKQNVVIVADLEELEENFFDIITLWQSFEHINNPRETLEKIKKLLKDDGRLFISVPNIQSWQAKLFKGKWFHLDPIRHCIHYSLDTLTILANESGFHVEKSDTTSIEFGIFGWLQSILNGLGIRFNELYKRLKAREDVSHTSPGKFRWAFYILAGPIILSASTLLFLIESLIQRGAVLNVTLLKK